MNPRTLLTSTWRLMPALLLLPLHTVMMGINSCAFQDADGDGWNTHQGDCDDTNASINPAAFELCDGADNNCDGQIDEGFDSDSDGVADCFDLETCDGLDNNGDGRIDEGFDVDGDGSADCSGVTFCSSEDGLNTLADGSPAVLTWAGHTSWTATIPGAAWIWDEYLESNPQGDEVHSIFRSFNLPSGYADLNATLELAADNSYDVFLDGVQVAADSTEYNYRAPSDVVDLTGTVQAGSHQLEFRIHNWALAGGTSYTNPGGLLYCLSLSYSYGGGNSGPVTSDEP